MCMLVFVVEVRNFEMVAQTSKVLLESKDRWLTVWANCLQSLKSCED